MKNKNDISYLVNIVVIRIGRLGNRHHFRLLPSPVHQRPVRSTALCNEILGVWGEGHAGDLIGLDVRRTKHLPLAQRVQVVDGDRGFLRQLLGQRDVTSVWTDTHRRHAMASVGARDELLRFLVDVVQDGVGTAWIDDCLFVHIADVAADLALQTKGVTGCGSCDGHGGIGLWERKRERSSHFIIWVYLHNRHFLKCHCFLIRPPNSFADE